MPLASSQVSLAYTMPHSDLVFNLEPLAHAIEASQSTYRVLPVKIELKLIKKVPHVKWNKLEGDEEQHVSAQPGGVKTGAQICLRRRRDALANLMRPKEPKMDSAAPAPRRQRNWDKLVLEDEEEERELHKKGYEQDPNWGGDTALQRMFEKLYAGATDEQRMAMIKSYQESNGTSLSTNWDEVKQAPVETRPPESMIAKKYNS